MADIRARKFAQIIIDHSMKVKPGDKVALYAGYSGHLALPVLTELYKLALERGAYPHPLIDMAEWEDYLLTYGNDQQLDFVPLFHQMAFEQFDVLIKVRAETNTHAHSRVPTKRLARLQKMKSRLIEAQMRRGADESLRWMSTIYPTAAFAQDAEMGTPEFQDFFYRACHADEDTPDPVAYWQNIQQEQQRIIDFIQGHDQVQLRGPNVDLNLSIQNRVFKNACGLNNLPDGEIYTGPVEDSVNGWVRYTYPAVYQGRVVEGVELAFEQGKVVKASATKNEDYLLAMLNTDPGARYLGEFAIGTNFEINRFTGSILLDEKIGGSFHLAVGAGYPETGNTNKSAIHWDMICDLRQDSEITVDGELFYKNGQFVI